MDRTITIITLLELLPDSRVQLYPPEAVLGYTLL